MLEYQNDLILGRGQKWKITLVPRFATLPFQNRHIVPVHLIRPPSKAQESGLRIFNGAFQSAFLNSNIQKHLTKSVAYDFEDTAYHRIVLEDILLFNVEILNKNQEEAFVNHVT